LENISNILTVAGISIEVFLITLSINELHRNKSKILLVLILITFTPLFLSYNLSLNQNSDWLFSVLPFTSCALILVGPLLYEYAFQFFNAHHKKLFEEKKKYIPFITCSILLITTYFLFPQTAYRYVLIATVGISFIHLIYYLIKLIRYQIKSAKKLKHFYSSLADKNLFWVNTLIAGFFLVLLFDTISGIIIAITELHTTFIANTIFLLCLIWYLGYYSLSQRTISHNVHEYKTPVTPQKKNDLCNTDDFQTLRSKLDTAMQQDELYKLEEINLTILSNNLGVPVKKTSYLLNQCMNTTFYDLINDYRLAEFKSKVKNGELKEKTILGLAFESGFNSKATFNRIFKQKEKITPIQFVKSQKTS